MKPASIILAAIFIAVFYIVSPGCAKKQEQVIISESSNDKLAKYEVTFIELGSDKCIPCVQMQPVMKAIKERFKDKVNVVFHDVWKDKDAAKKYGIQLIPTQVFLDEMGNEFYRHEGFFAEEEIISLLETKGLKPAGN